MNFSGVIKINKYGIIALLFIVFLLLLYTYKGSNQGLSDSLNGLSSRAQKRVSLKQILIAAVDLSIKGGDQVVAVKKSVQGLGEKLKGKTKEGAKDPVTDGDYRSHRVMYNGIKRAFSGINVISEEHPANEEDTEEPYSPRSDSAEISNYFIGDEYIDSEDITVWIDPLDATHEYTENLLQYVSTMMCIAVKGVPIGGVIHFPFSKETFWAVVGFGSSANINNYISNLTLSTVGEDDELPETKKDDKLKPKLKVVVSRSHAGGAKDYISNALGGSPFELITAAGSGYKVIQLIKGEADVYVHITDIKKWDLCSGNAILNAVNGKMLTIHGGNTLDYSSDSDPLNSKGIISFLKSSDSIDRLSSFNKDEPLTL